VSSDAEQFAPRLSVSAVHALKAACCHWLDAQKDEQFYNKDTGQPKDGFTSVADELCEAAGYFLDDDVPCFYFVPEASPAAQPTAPLIANALETEQLAVNESVVQPTTTQPAVCPPAAALPATCQPTESAAAQSAAQPAAPWWEGEHWCSRCGMHVEDMFDLTRCPDCCPCRVFCIDCGGCALDPDRAVGLAAFKDEAADADGFYGGRCARCNPRCVGCFSGEACNDYMYGSLSATHLMTRECALVHGFRSIDWESGIGVCASCAPRWSAEELARRVKAEAECRADEFAEFRASQLAWRDEQRATLAAEEAEFEGTTVAALAGRLEGLLPPFLRENFRRELCGVCDQ
jgi:hypothetical protein